MKKTFFLIIFTGILLCASWSASETGSPDENKLKAAFVYHFAKFIDWPESTFATEQSPLIITVFGADNLARALDPLNSRAVRNHPIQIRSTADITKLQPCHILYIGTTERKTVARIIALLQDTPVVTLSDMENFARSGGMIQFVNVRDRLRFAINNRTAQAKDLVFNSQLLSLAIEVIEE